MRKFPALILLSASVCFAQRFPPINIAGSDPTGTACSVVNALQQYTNHMYICTSGTWQAVGGGASGSVSGQTVNSIPKASGATALTAPSALSDNGSVVSSTEPVSATRLTSTELGTSTATVCPNGPGGALTTSGCAAAGGTVSGQSVNSIPKASGASALTSPSALSDDGTTVSSTEPVIVGALGAGSVSSATIGGSRYAARWGDGSTNGIATAVGTGQTVFASPAYPTTEHYTFAFNSFTEAPAAVQSHVIDYRQGSTTETCRDPLGTLLDGFNNCYTLNYQNYLNQGPNSLGRPHAMQIYSNFLQPGFDGGSVAVGPTNWTVGLGLSMNQVSASPGIHESLASVHYKTGIGDNVGGIFYNSSYGGAVAAADEGNHGLSTHGDEDTITFKGTIAAGGGGTGATSLKVTCTLDCNVQSGGPGDGRYVVDQTVVIDSGNITATTGPSGLTPGTFTVDHTITPSTAIGTLNGACNTGAVPSPLGTGYNTVTCSVNLTSGTFASGSSPVCFNGQFHEQALISSVTGAGPYSVTMNLRHAHQTGSMIAQGGPCGTFLDITANDVGSTLHFPIDLIGAPDNTHYYWVFFYLGSGTNVNGGSPVGGFGALNLTTQGATNLTNIGGTVYFTATLNTNFPQMIGTTTFFSAASGGLTGYNGACINTKFNIGNNQFSCTQSSSNGLGVAATATLVTGTSQYGTSAYTVWAGAEVLDVLDHSVNPPVMYNNGVFTLTTEPNIGTWADSDGVEESHHYAERLGNLFTAISQNKMIGSSNGLGITIGGPGSCCGNFSAGGSFSNTYPALEVSNLGASNSQYKYHGGTVTPPGALHLRGTWNYGIVMDVAPDPYGTPAIYVGCPVSGCNDPSYFYNPLLYLGNGSTSNGLQFTPNISTTSTVGTWLWGSDFGKQIFRDSITFGQLIPPVLSTPTAVPSQGSLPDATTYFYTVYAVNSTGVSLISNEKSVTTGSSGGINSVPLNWTMPIGATQYFVCRGTSTGAELRGPNIVGINKVTYTDNGSNAFSGSNCATLTATDTSRAGIDFATYLGVLNPNGTTETKIGPGTATTNITVTLPETGTAGSLIDKTTGATATGNVPDFSNITGRLEDGNRANLSGTASFPLGVGTGTTTPTVLSLGSTYGTNTVGTTGNCKLDIFQDNSTTRYCLGISSALMEYQAPSTAHHGFFVAGTKILDIGSAATNVTSGSLQVGGVAVTLTIASGTATMTTAAIASGACGTTVTVAATNTATTDSITYAYNAAVAANPGVLILNRWPTAGNVNFAYCNPTAASVTPTAATLNWRVAR